MKFKMKDDQIKIKISKELKERFRALCNLNYMDMSSYLTKFIIKETDKAENKKAIENYLKQEEKKPKEYLGNKRN